MSKLSAIGRGLKTVVSGAVQAPGAIVGFTGAAAVGTVGGVIKLTGKGLVSGAKAVGKMKTKIIGESAEAAIKNGTDDVVEAAVKNGTDDVVKAARKPVNNYRNNTSFTYDGASYRRQGDVYQRKVKGGNWENVSSKEYGHSRASFISENANLEQVANLEHTTVNAKSGAGFWDGIPGWAKTAGIATAGVIAGGVIFGDDDDEY